MDKLLLIHDEVHVQYSFRRIFDAAERVLHIHLVVNEQQLVHGV